MKHLRRLLSLLLAAGILCLSLCSCTQLDAAKESHAVWEDDAHTALTLDGVRYRLLPEELVVNTNLCGCLKGHLTEPDVPVLMASWFGDTYYTDADRRVIVYSPNAYEHWIYDTPGFGGSVPYGYDGETIRRLAFCREDLYPTLLAAADQPYDRLLTTDYEWDEGNNNYRVKANFLTDAQTAFLRGLTVAENRIDAAPVLSDTLYSLEFVAGDATGLLVGERYYLCLDFENAGGYLMLCDQPGQADKQEDRLYAISAAAIEEIETLFGDRLKTLYTPAYADEEVYYE